MFGWFSRPRVTSTPARRRRPVPLTLERLEARDCPSGGDLLIMSLNVSPLNDGKRVQVTGTVEDGDPTANVCLNFSGVASGQCWADSVGAFNYTTTATGLGTVNAVAVDSDGQISTQRSANLSVAAPTLSQSVSYGTQRNVTLSGTVTAGQAAGLTVGFSGKVTGSATTNAYGNYSLSAQAPALGTVTASVTDVWGQTGTAQVSLTSNAPYIDSFTATRGSGNGWTFRGHVTDESAAGLTVTFGGLTELQGRTATVLSDGTFSVGAVLAAGESGGATARTTDWWGLASNSAVFMVMS